MNYYHLDNIKLPNCQISFTCVFTCTTKIDIISFNTHEYHDMENSIDLEYTLSPMALQIIDQLIYDKYKNNLKFKAKIDKGCKETLKKRLKEIQQGK